MSDGPERPRVVDNPNVSEIYANRAIGTSFDGGGISILFGCSRVIPEFVDSLPQKNEQPSVFVTGRLTLSPAGAVELMNQLNQILAVLTNAQNSPISVSRGSSQSN
jgi:hypothetical protein